MEVLTFIMLFLLIAFVGLWIYSLALMGKKKEWVWFVVTLFIPLVVIIYWISKKV